MTNKEKFMNFMTGLKMWQKLIIVFLVVGLLLMALVVNRPDTKEVLYPNLTQEDSNAIRNELAQTDIAYSVDKDGVSIKVEAEDVGRATMLLAEKGLPKDEQVGYELFNESSMFASSSQQKVQLKYTTINEIEKKIQNSFGSFLKKVTVSLDFQQDENLWEEEKVASASVNVHVKENRSLTEEEVKSIQHMVAGNLINLSAKEVVVTDGNGYTYETGDDSYGGAKGYSKQQDVVELTKKRIEKDLKATLNQTLLPGNYTLNLVVNINFDEVIKNIETIKPNETAVISKEEKKELVEKMEAGQEVEAGTEANGDVPDYEQDAADETAAYKQEKSELIENYEVGKIVETVKENPEVSKVFVTVTIDREALDQDMPEEDFMAYADQWKMLLANAAGVELNQENQFQNGNVVVTVIDYGKTPNDEATDAGESAGIEEEVFNKNAVRNGSIIVAAGLVLFALFMIFGPRSAVRTGKKKDAGEVPDTLVAEKPAEFYQAEGQPASITEKPEELTYDEFQSLPEDEKMRLLKEGKVNERMKQRYTDEVYQLAEENPEKTAEYLRTKIKEG